MGKAPANLLNLLGRIKFRRRNLIAFAYAFGAAITFWVFNALGNRYDAYVEYPTEIQYASTEFIATSKVPSSVSVAVTGTGWSILRHQLEQHPPLVVVVNDSLLQSQPFAWDVFLPEIRKRFYNLTVTEFQARTSTIPVERLRRKTVVLIPAYLDTEWKAECLPPYVEVSGPAAKVNALPDTIRLEVSVPNPSNGYAERIKLKREGADGITWSTSHVIVSFNAVKTDTIFSDTVVQAGQ